MDIVEIAFFGAMAVAAITASAAAWTLLRRR
jgi:hypothetical protein